MLMTGEQYIESLRKLKTRVYMFGEQIENWVDHPIICLLYTSEGRGGFAETDAFENHGRTGRHGRYSKTSCLL